MNKIHFHNTYFLYGTLWTSIIPTAQCRNLQTIDTLPSFALPYSQWLSPDSDLSDILSCNS